MIALIRSCKSLKFTSHAKEEMVNEEYGIIAESEVRECVNNGEVIEEYPKDRPYSSCLIYGRTSENRPLHVVCAPVVEEGVLIIITVYEPNPALWIEYKRRKQ